MYKKCDYKYFKTDDELPLSVSHTLNASTCKHKKNKKNQLAM